MSKKHRRLLISLLATMVFFAGCIEWSYAEENLSEDTPTSGAAGFGFTLERHSLSHQEGFFWGVTDDTDDSTYSSLMAECSWQDGDKACWYHYAPTIYLFVGAAEYDGNRHGATLKWRWDNQAAPDQDFHTINGNSDYPDPDRLPGVRVWNSGYDGETLAGERYIKKDAPILPGKYEAEALVSFESLGDPDTHQLVSPHYDIKPKELTLNWSGDTEFPYDGQAHAPTVELPTGQIVGNDVVSVTRTTEKAVGVHTAKATLTGKDSWKYTIADASQTKDYIITSPYDVQFDSNVPANASTTCTGSMENQHFEYNEEKALNKNSYALPGYEFNGWNTKADGSGTAYPDKAEVQNLSDNGGAVILYAQWREKPYTIEYWSDDVGSQKHIQTGYFDQPGKLDVYSDSAFGWDSGGKTLHGWSGLGLGSFYEDGDDFCNLCGAPDADGNLADLVIVADWVQNGQIVVTVTKDGAPQKGLKDYFVLAQDSATFTVTAVYANGKYVFDPSQAVAPGGQVGQLPEGEYDIQFDAPDYPLASAHITYGEEHTVSVVFDYYTVSLAKDPAYADFHSIEIAGGKPVAGASNTVVALDGGTLNIKTTVEESCQFDGYTATGVEPGWESGDPFKASQSIEVQGRADIMAHIKAAPATRPTISGITNLTGDNALTYGYAENDGRISVTASAATDTTYKDLTYQWYSCNSDGSGAKAIDTADEPAAATKDYVIPTGKTAGNYYYYCKVTATRLDNDQTASADSGVATVSVKKQELTIIAKDQTYVYNGQTQGEGDTVYEDPAQIAEKITVEGLQGSDALTSITIDGQGQEIGEYDLIPSNATIGEATGNYKISYVNGTLTITKPVSFYTVTFVDGQGKTLKTEKVESGKAATAPADPKRDGYTFTGWDKDFSKVTADMTVTAQWKKNAAPEPTVRGVFMAKITAKGKKSLTISWGEVDRADGYDIFFARCKHGKKKPAMKKIGTIQGSKDLKWTKKGLKGKTAYKAKVRAYVMKGGKKEYISTSPLVHAYTSGSTKHYTNAKSVTVRERSVSLKEGKTYKLKAKVNKLKKGKRLMQKGHAARLRYKSSNPDVAKVNRSGKITAKSKGICYVYVYAVNGAYKKVKVVIK